MGENMVFSNYTEILPYKGRIAIYNKINGQLVVMDADKMEQKTDDKWSLTINDVGILRYLIDNLFFLSDDQVQDKLCDVNRLEEDYSDVTLVISTTERCNCDCAYCYQHAWPHTCALSNQDYVNWIIEYISKIVDKADKNARLTIKYFGGEPLLNLDLITDLNSKLEALIQKRNRQMSVYYEMDSNCTLLTRDVLKQFNNLSIATTLSLPEDHNALRAGTFQKTLDNLLDVSDLFKLPQYQLVIGYNAHHGNIAGFRAFLEFIKGTGLECRIDVSNIVNNGGSVFRNSLNNEDFERFYCDSIIPLLVEYKYPVNILPPYGIYRRCNGTNTLNRKFYSNGTQTLCSYFSKKQDKEASDYPTPVSSLSYMHQLPEMCIKCYDFPYCGGIRPCFNCDGSYHSREFMRNRIRTYLDLRGEGLLCTDT